MNADNTTPRRRRRTNRNDDVVLAAPVAPAVAEARVAELAAAPPPAAAAPAAPAAVTEDSVAAAERRAAELLEGGIELDTSVDKYDFPSSMVPDGWTYEWKTYTVYGQQNLARQTEQQRMGWEPVPASRHPDMMPLGYSGNTIERDGLILMQRPKAITDRVRAFEKRKALEQVRVKEAALAQAPNGQFARGTNPNAPVRVGKEFAPAAFAIPGNTQT